MIGDEALTQAVRARNAILFVGSGVSVGLGLPSWKTLVEHMVRETGLDADTATRKGINYLTLAEFYFLKHGSIGPLRSWMDRHFSASDNQILESGVLSGIVDLDWPIIYTTNFDRNLEEAHRLRGRAYTKIANAKDLARGSDSRTQIVKLHGDFDDDASLVLTESAYFDRLSFDSPLDIKLRADALGKTILFVGYSLSDVNIRLLLHKIWRTWRGSGYERERPKSYIFMIAPDPVEETVLAKWGIQTLSAPGTRPENALRVFLDQLASEVRGPSSPPAFGPDDQPNEAA